MLWGGSPDVKRKIGSIAAVLNAINDGAGAGPAPGPRDFHDDDAGLIGHGRGFHAELGSQIDHGKGLPAEVDDAFPAGAVVPVIGKPLKSVRMVHRPAHRWIARPS